MPEKSDVLRVLAALVAGEDPNAVSKDITNAADNNPGCKP